MTKINENLDGLSKRASWIERQGTNSCQPGKSAVGQNVSEWSQNSLHY